VTESTIFWILVFTPVIASFPYLIDYWRVVFAHFGYATSTGGAQRAFYISICRARDQMLKDIKTLFEKPSIVIR
jgi:hypothetical protein